MHVFRDNNVHLLLTWIWVEVFLSFTPLNLRPRSFSRYGGAELLPEKEKFWHTCLMVTARFTRQFYELFTKKFRLPKTWQHQTKDKDTRVYDVSWLLKRYFFPGGNEPTTRYFSPQNCETWRDQKFRSNPTGRRVAHNTRSFEVIRWSFIPPICRKRHFSSPTFVRNVSSSFRGKTNYTRKYLCKSWQFCFLRSARNLVCMWKIMQDVSTLLFFWWQKSLA